MTSSDLNFSNAWLGFWSSFMWCLADTGLRCIEHIGYEFTHYQYRKSRTKENTVFIICNNSVCISTKKTVNIFLIVYKIVTYQLLILLNIGISEKVIPFITFLYGLYKNLNIPNIIGPYGPKIMVITLRSSCQNISELWLKSLLFFKVLTHLNLFW